MQGSTHRPRSSSSTPAIPHMTSGSLPGRPQDLAFATDEVEEGHARRHVDQAEIERHEDRFEPNPSTGQPAGGPESIATELREKQAEIARRAGQERARQK